MNKMRYKEKFHDAFHEAIDKGIVKTGTDLGCTYTFAMLQALKDMAENNVWPDGRFGDDDCNVWSLFHLYESESDDRDDELRTLRGINQSLFKANNALEERNKALKAEIERLKENLAHISGVVQAFLIFSDELSLDNNNRIVNNKTGELLSE